MTGWMFLALGLSISIAVSGFMAVAGIGDIPERRSSHQKITPTSGGLGVVAAIAVLSLLLGQTGYLSREFAQILSLVWATAFLGFMDDIFNLSAIVKFLILWAIALATIWVLGPVRHLPFGSDVFELPLWLSWAGSALWIFVVVNIVNFMDGSNGLLLITMGIASTCLAWIGIQVEASEPILLLIMLMIGILGLSIYNVRPKAVIFSGDVGSLTIGYVFAVCVIWISKQVEFDQTVYIGPVLILPLLTDGFLTLARRARHGEKLMQAHRTHLYQRLISGGWGHISVAIVYGVVTCLLGVYAIWAISWGGHLFVNFVLLPFFVLMALFLVLGRRYS